MNVINLYVKGKCPKCNEFIEDGQVDMYMILDCPYCGCEIEFAVYSEVSEDE